MQRDQQRLADMRGNLMRTQKELKRLRELVLETVETPLSAPVHDTLEKLITHNRRVNYRVEPPPSLAAHCRFDQAVAPISPAPTTSITSSCGRSATILTPSCPARCSVTASLTSLTRSARPPLS